ncbi:MAG: hypothetical protein ACO3IB_12895, partial [Phycisphaerales bacterium]
MRRGAICDSASSAATAARGACHAGRQPPPCRSWARCGSAATSAWPVDCLCTPSHARAVARRRVAVLGCTGSVGTQALEILRAHADRFEVCLLAAHTSAQALGDAA